MFVSRFFQTSYVSDSMYLVMETPSDTLYMGENVHLKVHALLDESTLGRVAGVLRTKESVENADGVTVHGTLFITDYRILFRSFQVRWLVFF